MKTIKPYIAVGALSAAAIVLITMTSDQESESHKEKNPPSVAAERTKISSRSVVASQAAPRNTKKEEQVAATTAVRPDWLAKYTVPANALDEDPDQDGVSNREEMLAGTDPFNGGVSPYPAEVPNFDNITEPMGDHTWAARRAFLLKAAKAQKVVDVEFQRKLLRDAEKHGHPMVKEGEDGLLSTLSSISEDGTPTYISESGISQAATSGIDQLWPANSITAVAGWTTGATGLDLDGSGQRFAIWEASSGVQLPHDQLTGRVTQPDSATTTSGHATQVAGVIAANGADEFLGSPLNFGNSARGMAYASEVDAYTIGQFGNEWLTEAAQGTRIANFSFEQNSGWAFLNGAWTWFSNAGTSEESDLLGAYTSDPGSQLGPVELDNQSVMAPNSLMVFAASNSANRGPGSPVANYPLAGGGTSSDTRDWANGDGASVYDSLAPTAVAKNVLSVGACLSIDFGYTNPADVVLAGFSAAGPTDDGRIKPEIVAAGSRSSVPGPRNPLGIGAPLMPTFSATATNTFAAEAGTSFSAPVVTGGLGLVLQRRHDLRPLWESNDYPIQSSTLRALAVHTADEAGPHPGPDFLHGYGLFNGQRAVELTGTDAEAGVTSPNLLGTKPHVKEILLKPFQGANFNVTAVSSSEPLKVTLAWTDPAGPAATVGSVDETTKRLVHDLDLTVTGPGGVVLPWVLDPDLAGESASVRALAATRGDDSVNNLEQVVIDNPVAGATYTISVNAKTPVAGAGQWISLILSNNAVAPENFQITQFLPFGPGFWLIAWNSVPGGVYRIQASPNLVTWIDLADTFSAREETTQTFVSAPGLPPSYFWRVVRDY